MYTENANRAFHYGRITPKNLEPEPKNPIIANFFHQIQFADEFGSGVRNLFHYGRIYSNADPVFDEDDVFRIILPLNDDYSADREVDKASATGTAETAKATTRETNRGVSPQVSPQSVGAESARVLELIRANERIRTQAIADAMHVSRRTVLRHIKEFASIGLRFEGPTKRGRWVFDGEKVQSRKS